MMHSPLHAGIFLKQTFLDELNISCAELARRLGVSRGTISRLTKGEIGISIEMSQRLSQGLHGTPEFWLNMQRNHDLWEARNNQHKGVNKKWLTSNKEKAAA